MLRNGFLLGLAPRLSLISVSARLQLPIYGSPSLLDSNPSSKSIPEWFESHLVNLLIQIEPYNRPNFMDDINKHAYELIDKILWNDWDPIGINRVQGPRNEYDSYLSKVSDLKMTGAECETIAQYLFQIETVHMGLNGNLEHCRRVAEKIISLVL